MSWFHRTNDMYGAYITLLKRCQKEGVFSKIQRYSDREAARVSSDYKIRVKGMLYDELELVTARINAKTHAARNLIKKELEEINTETERLNTLRAFLMKLSKEYENLYNLTIATDAGKEPSVAVAEERIHEIQSLLLRLHDELKGIDTEHALLKKDMLESEHIEEYNSHSN